MILDFGFWIADFGLMNEERVFNYFALNYFANRFMLTELRSYWR